MFDNPCEKSGVKLQIKIEILFSFTEKVSCKVYFSFKKADFNSNQKLFESKSAFCDLKVIINTILYMLICQYSYPLKTFRKGIVLRQPHLRATCYPLSAR